MATPAFKAPDVPARGEQRVLLSGVAWRDYIIVREAIDSPGVRMTYCEGLLEIRSPSREHEIDKKAIARLLEYYAIIRDLALNGYGAPTFRKEAKARGCEPDECYTIDRAMREHEFPDIVLEVIHSSPLLDKLTVYQAFGVAEVWLFEEGRFTIHGLEGDGYVVLDRSRLLPDLDFNLIARLATLEDQRQALRELRAALT